MSSAFRGAGVTAAAGMGAMSSTVKGVVGAESEFMGSRDASSETVSPSTLSFGSEN